MIMIAGWYGVFVIKETPLELPNIGELTREQEVAFMFVGSALILAFCGVPTMLFYALFTATFCIIVHAMLQRGGGGVGLSTGAAYAPVRSGENEGLMHSPANF